MPTQCRIVADSISEAGVRLTSIEVEFPRFLLPELNTHRVFSRSYASSRAIPVKETLRRVQEEPFIPTYWGKNQKGMQANEECNELVWVDTPTVKSIYDGLQYEPLAHTREEAWLSARAFSVDVAEGFDRAGYHKQLVNRLLEPFSYCTGIITATEWDNFFLLRTHKDAQPEFQELAKAIKQAMDESTPKLLYPGDWHLPYVDTSDVYTVGQQYMHDCQHMTEQAQFEWLSDKTLEKRKKLSAARCARASFASNQRGQTFTIEQDLALYDRLFGPPLHAGPFEHSACPMQFSTATDALKLPEWEAGITHMDRAGNLWSNNFRGWVQGRALLQQA